MLRGGAIAGWASAPSSSISLWPDLSSESRLGSILLEVSITTDLISSTNFTVILRMRYSAYSFDSASVLAALSLAS